MTDFDFIKGFAGVDILQAEAVAEVVGRVVAALFKGMVEAGLPEAEARRILRDAWAELLRSVVFGARP